MDQQKARKVKIAVAIGGAAIAGILIGIGIGYGWAVNQCIDIGTKILNFDLKPEAKELLRTYFARSGMINWSMS